MKQYTVAIVGATGAVGTQMLQCLEEQEFPVGELKLLASPRSAGKKVETPWGEVVIDAAAPECFDGVDIVLGAAEDDVAKALYPEAVRRGAVVVDNSHAFRLDEGVPLVVPRDQRGRHRLSPRHHRQPQLRHHHRPGSHLAAAPAGRREAHDRLHLPGRIRRRHARHAGA